MSAWLNCPSCDSTTDQIWDGVCPACHYILNGGDQAKDDWLVPTWQVWRTHSEDEGWRAA